jgi:hypothetical protein
MVLDTGQVQRDAEFDVARFFEGDAEGRVLFDAVAASVEALGECDMRVTKSQIAFLRRRGFAYVWRPDRYVNSTIPAVLSIALPQRLASTRFKQVVHPAPTVWMHHLELASITDIDDEVRGWLAAAYDNAV